MQKDLTMLKPLDPEDLEIALKLADEYGVDPTEFVEYISQFPRWNAMHIDDAVAHCQSL